jgi:hypothetical protein
MNGGSEGSMLPSSRCSSSVRPSMVVASCVLYLWMRTLAAYACRKGRGQNRKKNGGLGFCRRV